ncbi:NmrA family NAD(P)-binding protein [Acetobacterium tundrae]|uniref:NAD(P)H-binding protein n=1 Tax=Acetobacterium tundrae TaxID=132932 RepID=A0ABR6WN87_9FIRM|nr:NmrA family NAD(P)-binding protein [Acetobacterium tundrae]MBC3797620.1 NAD(P)H-binding protein [Acetobacterium tundrae]
MRYIVTGADGQLGGRVASNMLKEVSGDQLIFTCPDLNRLRPERTKDWEEKDVIIKEANYDDKAQMTEAFKGGDRIYIVSGVIIGPERVQQHKNVIDAAIEAGVKHITYTSFFGANRPEYKQYVLPDHTATEEYLISTGVDYNIMRNSLYLENYLLNSVMMANLDNNRWVTTAGDGKATFIAKDDSGRVATALLLGKGENNKGYDVTGQLVSEHEICELINAISGKNYEYITMNEEEYYDYLDSIYIPRTSHGNYSKSPVPWCANDMVTNESGIRDGLMALETDTVEILTGNKPMNPKELLEKYSFVWKENITTYWDLGKVQ